MTRILLLVPTLDQSGAEKQFSLLATRLPREEFEVHVVALTRGGPFQSLLAEQGIPVTVLSKRWKLDPSTLWKLRSLIGEIRPDIVLSCLFAGNAYSRLATLAGGASRPRIAISERCVDSWKSRWQLWIDRRLVSRTDLLVANSESVATFYKSLGFPPDKVRVVPNGVMVPDLPRITREELCREVGLPDDAQLVGFVGRLAPQKRLPDLLWAAQVLRQANDRAYLLIIGDGPSREELELCAKDLEVADHVRFLGHRSDASSLLHLVDVFWLASEYEGMSNSLMEAMACGKPAVVSDIPPNRELVEHGKQGWVVNLGDSVAFGQFTVQLFNQPQTAQEMGSAAQERMRDAFSVEKMVTAYQEIFRELAS